MASILVIDDEEMMRISIKVALERLGHQVIEAADGKEGVDVYKSSPTDLVITDLIMPEQEGVETIVQLKGEFPDLKIIAMSGGGRMNNMDFLEVAQHLGANAILKKPFRKAELEETLNKVL